MLLVNLFLSILLCHLSSTYRILVVFPIPGKSHAILGEGLVRHLLDAGHEVTYVTAIEVKNFHPRLRQIDVSSNNGLMPVEKLFNIADIIKSPYRFQNILESLYMIANFTYSTIKHPNVQRLIYDSREQFDVVIAEWFLSELYSGLSVVFNCPLIWSSSMEPHSLVLELIDDVQNPAYNPSYLSYKAPPFSFFGRVGELWMMIKFKFYKWWLQSTEDRYFTNAFANAIKKNGQDVPPYDEVRYNASLVLGNSNIASGPSVQLPQNYIAIGGYHINKSIDPLPPNINTILEKANNGLIYFSMGSMANSSSIPNKIKKGLLDTFRKLNQTVLWKFEEEVVDLPENVHIVSWAPQSAILAHANCKLFITHGGLLSIIEAIHFGVPIIGIPLFGDQNLNVDRAVKKGFGVRVNLSKKIGIYMNDAINEVLYNDRFSKKIKEFSQMYHDRVTPPEKLITHWVSHVVRTKGARHLRSSALLIPWYQKWYIDLAAVIIITLYILRKISIVAFNRIVLLKQKLL